MVLSSVFNFTDIYMKVLLVSVEEKLGIFLLLYFINFEIWQTCALYVIE